MGFGRNWDSQLLEKHGENLDFVFKIVLQMESKGGAPHIIECAQRLAIHLVPSWQFRGQRVDIFQKLPAAITDKLLRAMLARGDSFLFGPFEHLKIKIRKYFSNINF